ncbi:MAG TPA: nucleoside monophosphate kinase [Candidatus Saccharimonadales bacterium]|nr:nucleoside monophosphate kinase [Candidatus Saccharimonadales bacterium]
MSRLNSPELLLLNGPPWSGKTSIAKYALQESFLGGAAHLSVGDLKRKILAGKRGSAYSQQLAERTVGYRHHSVPAGDAITGIVEEFLTERGTGLTVVDGYPRYPDRIMPFDRMVTRLGARVVGLCIVEADDQILRERSRYDRPGRPALSEAEVTERLADYHEAVTPTIAQLSERYPTYHMDGALPVADNAQALAGFYVELQS